MIRMQLLLWPSKQARDSLRPAAALAIALNTLCFGADASGSTEVDPTINSEARTCRAVLRARREFVAERLGEHSLCVRIPMADLRALRQFAEVLKVEKPRRLFLSAHGGYTYSAIAMSLLVRWTGVELVIADLCLSACANWIFPAARRVHVAERALVGWHGGPVGFEFIGAVWTDNMAVNLDKLARSVALEFTLEWVYGIDARVVYIIPADIRAEYRRVKSEHGTAAFRTLPKDRLEKDYGFRNIGQYWWPSSDEVRQLGRTYGMQIVVPDEVAP